MIMEKSYKRLNVWKKADELAFQIYLETKNFPKEENYGITSQLRRSALSVPTNLVEGIGRQSVKELKRFANISLGSLVETEYLLEFSQRLNYLDSLAYKKLEGIRAEVGAMLWGFLKSL